MRESTRLVVKGVPGLESASPFVRTGRNLRTTASRFGSLNATSSAPAAAAVIQGDNTAGSRNSIERKRFIIDLPKVNPAKPRLDMGFLGRRGTSHVFVCLGPGDRAERRPGYRLHLKFYPEISKTWGGVFPLVQPRLGAFGVY